MLEQLRKPRPEFAEVVRRHFRLRKRQLLATANRWVEEARAAGPMAARRRGGVTAAAAAAAMSEADEAMLVAEAGAGAAADAGPYADRLAQLVDQLKAKLEKL